MKELRRQTDETLVSLYIQGNNAAFDLLLRRYDSKVFTYILYAVKQQEIAEDLFQDAFMRVITKLQKGQYTESGKFSSWIMRIAHNLIIDYFRQNQNDTTLSNDECETDIFDKSTFAEERNIEKEMIDRQTLHEIKALIKRLPENQREVILLRFYQDMSFKEIADITGVSINTALGRMRYALINLRRLAAEYNIMLAS